jgi:Probable transposase
MLRLGPETIYHAIALRTSTTKRAVVKPTVRAGVDLGVRTLATVATIDTAIGVETITEYPNPTPLKATLTARRWAGRELSRRIPDRAVTGQRKPSRPDSTADACICGGKPPTSSPPSGPAPTATSSLNTSMWPP